MSLTLDKVVGLYEAMPEGAQRTENKKNLSYLLHIASLSKADISRWQILPAFGSGEGDSFLNDKNAINRIFFEKLKKNFNRKKEEEPEVSVKTEEIPQLSALIDQYATQSIKQKIHSLEAAANTNRRRAKDAMVTIEQYLAEAAKQFREAAALKTGESEAGNKVRKEIQEVLKLDCWVDPVVNRQTLWLHTKSDVVIVHKNKAAGVDCEVNCGKFAVSISFPDFALRVFPYDNNLQLNRPGSAHIYYHPHVSYEGTICWGNAGSQVSDALPKGELAKALELLYSLLFNYHDASPYVHLLALRDEGTSFNFENYRAYMRNQGYDQTYYLHPHIPKMLEDQKAKKVQDAQEALKAAIAQPQNGIVVAGVPLLSVNLAPDLDFEARRIALQDQLQRQQFEESYDEVEPLNPDDDDDL